MPLTLVNEGNQDQPVMLTETERANWNEELTLIGAPETGPLTASEFIAIQAIRKANEADSEAGDQARTQFNAVMRVLSSPEPQ